MAGDAKRIRFPWIAAAAGALLVAAGGLSLLRLPPPPEPRSFAGEGGVSVPLAISQLGVGAEAGRLEEELALRDPAPLFLPTDWNSGRVSGEAGVRIEPGAAFGNFGPKLRVSEDEPAIAFPPVVSVPADAMAAAKVLGEDPVLRGLSRRELEVPPLPGRLARIEVSAAATGTTVLAEDWAATGADAEKNPLRETFWAPLELLLAVSPGGVIGRPALVASSGSEQVDTWALDFLMQASHLGARLEPGFYRVVLGP